LKKKQEKKDAAVIGAIPLLFLFQNSVKNSTNSVYLETNKYSKLPNEKIRLTTFSVIFNQLPSHRNHSFKPRWNRKN
jgi:hypothetical protein